jgi:hypothetical protein
MAKLKLQLGMFERKCKMAREALEHPVVGPRLAKSASQQRMQIRMHLYSTAHSGLKYWRLDPTRI